MSAAPDLCHVGKLVRALKSMLEETEGLVTLERRGLGLARYQALEAVELATGKPFAPRRLPAPSDVLPDVIRDVLEELEALRSPGVPDPDLETLIARLRAAVGMEERAVA